ncbi:hypothetical protein [Streptomyces sp. NPDC054783]
MAQTHAIWPIAWVRVPMPDPVGFCDHLAMVDSRNRSALRTLIGEVPQGLAA